MGTCCASEEIAGPPAIVPKGDITKKENDAATIGAPGKKEVSADPTAGRKKLYSKKQPIQLGYWKIRGLA